MSRQSSDEYRSGRVYNGYDYALQVWVLKGIIQDCGHPPIMQQAGPCCDAHRVAGQRLAEVPGHTNTRQHGVWI